MHAVTIQPADLPVQWQGISEHTTQRGRVRAVLTGIPGPAFWYSWKHDTAFRDKLRLACITVQRVAKGQWQAVVWCNRHNQALVENLGFTVPEAAPVDNTNPF